MNKPDSVIRNNRQVGFTLRGTLDAELAALIALLDSATLGGVRNVHYRPIVSAVERATRFTRQADGFIAFELTAAGRAVPTARARLRAFMEAKE